ncbi:hypothetical protein BLNAU_21377 [Blattamonas nauphoetae]|uniref:Uncharacterized protein n=1 Tax=Blattamonas nauphoetae TaxID=2049346 RepID=A0ABQ9WW45_9EUKA|nr:hypothetical protein BLNAU_21377 [Blattamonas nauphoetae]
MARGGAVRWLKPKRAAQPTLIISLSLSLSQNQCDGEQCDGSSRSELRNPLSSSLSPSLSLRINVMESSAMAQAEASCATHSHHLSLPLSLSESIINVMESSAMAQAEASCATHSHHSSVQTIHPHDRDSRRGAPGATATNFFAETSLLSALEDWLRHRPFIMYFLAPVLFANEPPFTYLPIHPIPSSISPPHNLNSLLSFQRELTSSDLSLSVKSSSVEPDQLRLSQLDTTLHPTLQFLQMMLLSLHESVSLSCVSSHKCQR